METLNVPPGIRKYFFNHAKSDVTDIYSQAEWALLREWMTKLEQSILVKAPNVYNSLKLADWQPVPAPPPHVCRPPNPRKGRPGKSNKAVAETLMPKDRAPNLP